MLEGRELSGTIALERRELGGTIVLEGRKLGGTIVLEGRELGGAIMLEGGELGSAIVLEGRELAGQTQQQCMQPRAAAAAPLAWARWRPRPVAAGAARPTDFPPACHVIN